MNDTELNHLIKMANQISDNVSHKDSPEVAAQRIANHMTRFWAPSMKDKIIQYAENGGSELKELTRLAVEQLAKAKS
ncbi:MAG: formate dehydrogenase [Pseudomonadales bacterium]|nr:formate dehydrogenase [Pseudomonadales bacterium]